MFWLYRNRSDVVKVVNRRHSAKGRKLVMTVFAEFLIMFWLHENRSDAVKSRKVVINACENVFRLHENRMHAVKGRKLVMTVFTKYVLAALE